MTAIKKSATKMTNISIYKYSVRKPLPYLRSISTVHRLLHIRTNLEKTLWNFTEYSNGAGIDKFSVRRVTDSGENVVCGSKRRVAPCKDGYKLRRASGTSSPERGNVWWLTKTRSNCDGAKRKQLMGSRMRFTKRLNCIAGGDSRSLEELSILNRTILQVGKW